MKDKLLRDAEMAINISQVKQATEEMKEFIPSIAELTMGMYKAFLDEGFNEEQAFGFAREYVFNLILPK